MSADAVKPWWKRWWGIALIGGCAISALNTVMPDEPKRPTPPVASAPVEFDPAYRDIGSGVYAFAMPAGVERVRVERAAKQQCEGKGWCQVLGWTEGSFMATAMPMLTREADALKFNYLLNRETDTEKIVWHCGEETKGNYILDSRNILG